MGKFKFLFGGGQKVTLPPQSQTSPKPPTSADPSVAAAENRNRQEAALRKGRAASILTPSGGGALGDAPVNRPGLRTTALLGG